VHEVRDDEADQGFEHHRGDGEDTGLLDHQPKRLPVKQEREIAEADEALHRLVERRQMQRVEGRV
jgi:hypothetical protein